MGSNVDAGRLSLEPITRWWLLWRLYGLPRCSQASYPEWMNQPCHGLIWPWQPREVRNGAPMHLACIEEPHDA